MGKWRAPLQDDAPAEGDGEDEQEEEEQSAQAAGSREAAALKPAGTGGPSKKKKQKKKATKGKTKQVVAAEGAGDDALPDKGTAAKGAQPQQQQDAADADEIDRLVRELNLATVRPRPAMPSPGRSGQPSWPRLQSASAAAPHASTLMQHQCLYR